MKTKEPTKEMLEMAMQKLYEKIINGNVQAMINYLDPRDPIERAIDNAIFLARDEREDEDENTI